MKKVNECKQISCFFTAVKNKKQTSKDFLLGKFHKCNPPPPLCTPHWPGAGERHPHHPAQRQRHQRGGRLPQEGGRAALRRLHPEAAGRAQQPVGKRLQAGACETLSCLRGVRFSLAGFHQAVFESCNKTAR